MTTTELSSKARATGTRQYARLAGGWAVSCKILKSGRAKFTKHTLLDTVITEKQAAELLAA